MRDAYGRAQSIIAGGRGGVRDIGLIYQWMKMNDPGSSVREGERADAANAGGVTEGIRNLYNRLLTGEVLLTRLARISSTKFKATIRKRPHSTRRP